MSEVPLYLCLSLVSGDETRRRRKVDVRLPGKGNSNSHGARPDHLIITMMVWIRTSRLSIKNSLSGDETSRRRRRRRRRGRGQTAAGFVEVGPAAAH